MSTIREASRLSVKPGLIQTFQYLPLRLQSKLFISMLAEGLHFKAVFIIWSLGTYMEWTHVMGLSIIGKLDWQQVQCRSALCTVRAWRFAPLSTLTREVEKLIVKGPDRGGIS